MNKDAINIEALVSGVSYLLPELIITLTILLIIIQDLVRRNAGVSFAIFISGIVVSLSYVASVSIPSEPWDSLLSLDSGSSISKWIIGCAGLLTGVMTAQKMARQKKIGEYFAMLASMVLGGFLAVSTKNFLIMIIALELISIPSYILTGFHFDKKGAEGALKYFLFGAASTAIMLYGISFFYGYTGMITLAGVSIGPGQVTGINAALILIVAGVLFKVAAVPMHVWLPDAYESAPTPVVAFFSVVPKIAGLVILTRLAIWHSNWFSDDLMLILLSIVAIVSMFAGNLGALSQTNVKRMLGYSTIAHSGFLIMAIISFDRNGVGNMLFYLAIYTVMNYGAFALADHLEKTRKISYVEQMSGLGKVMPLIGILFTIHLISLTGLPPTSGFLAKFLLFSGVWESYSLTGNWIYLAVLIIAIVNTVIALFFYIRIPFRMFLNDSVTSANFEPSVNVYLSTLLALVVLVLFFMPGLLIEVFNNVNFVL